MNPPILLIKKPSTTKQTKLKEKNKARALPRGRTKQEPRPSLLPSQPRPRGAPAVRAVGAGPPLAPQRSLGRAARAGCEVIARGRKELSGRRAVVPPRGLARRAGGGGAGPARAEGAAMVSKTAAEPLGRTEEEVAWAEALRGACEPEHHWRYRREFLLRNVGEPPAAGSAELRRLVSLSMVWANHVFLGCR